MNKIQLETIDVACAIIIHNGKVLLAQRSEKMKLPLKWEFPGGKIEPGESAEDCIIREIREELDIEISVTDKLSGVLHNYQYADIILHPLICKYEKGSIILHEHRAANWVLPEDILTYDLAGPDIPAAREFLNVFDSVNRAP